MEEYIGSLWDRWITQSSHGRHPEATVWLSDVEKSAGLLFRAFGGNPASSLIGVADSSHNAKRSWLARLGGTQKKVPLSWQEEDKLCLPEKIDLFPLPALNRDLYVWLIALQGVQRTSLHPDWITASQDRVCTVLNNFPGLINRYRRLLAAHMTSRPDPGNLPPTEAHQELLIRRALTKPGSVAALSACNIAPWPVLLWPHPAPEIYANSTEPRRPDAEPTMGESRAAKPESGHKKNKHRSERVEAPEENRGLILHRFESIFSWAEYIKVDRATDEEDEPENSKGIADDLEILSLARDNKPMAKRIRFDMDLPSEADDDLVLGGGRLLPEWDYKKNRLVSDYCRIIPMMARNAQPSELPPHLLATSRKIRGQFSQIKPVRLWFRRQSDGTELDLEAMVEARANQLRQQGMTQPPIFKDFRPGNRDLASLLLADLSLSTDTWVNNSQRIIDVIQDTLFLFSEALSAVSDPFALYGFSSRRRDHIRFHHIKDFSEPYNSQVRGRIQAIKPGYYTRLGAAIRQSTEILSDYPASRRLLLLLTDGKPNDLDRYEGRYGVEDTRMSILEAQKKGVRTFCVTIDEKAGEYCPYLFGKDGFIVLKNAKNLPSGLPLLYSRITR
ncbi:MAG: nitric oxide reductase activation protein [Magnetococcales bacterium]|nr:nitric oxide reductase activation protein [Magnetococcales bacterium]HIJ84155.1 nitric oxide reductase [Magnetococcales bacterium]